MSNIVNKSTDDRLNTFHISSNLENYEAARSAFFMFMPSSATDPVLQLVAEKLKTFNSESELTAEKIQELLKLNVTKAKVPHFSVETLKYRRGNEEVKFAGVPTFSSGSITVDDIVGIDTKSIIEALLELCYDLKSRTGGRMKDYKMDWTLIEYTQDYRPIRTWTLKGCFITGYDESDFDKESDGRRSISINFEYDRAEVQRGLSAKASDTDLI